MTLKFFVLKDRQVVPASLEQWAAFFSSPERVVAQWDFAEGTIRVSTVFIGHDPHSGPWTDRPPQVFETMIFGGPMDQHQERTATWQEAEQTHERVCAEVTRRVLQ